MNIVLSQDLVFDIGSLVVYLGVSAILGALIGYTYKITHKGVTYSQGIANTLVLLSVVTAFIVYFIGDSMARAIGLFGVFSIIRYRSAVKDTRDTAFILLALGLGMACGVGSLILAAIGTITIVVIVLVVDGLNLFSGVNTDYLVFFKAQANKGDSKEVIDSLKPFVKEISLLSVKALDSGKLMDFSISIKLKRNMDISTVVEELQKIDGISDVRFLAAKKDIQF